MIPLSPETINRIQHVFDQPMRARVEQYLLTECGDNLPLVDPAYAELAERIRFAVLRLSQGDFSALQKWVNSSKQDWRDTLVAAGFGNTVKGHLDWRPESE